jgi:alkylglycerol monooxygenase
MKQLLVALAMPVFFMFILVEAWLAKRRRVECYRFSDAVTDLACGVTSQISVFYWGRWLQETYASLYQNYRFFELPDSWATWIFGFLLLDFLFYWFHRLSHEVNFLWAVHIVHHQSEDYNLAVGLRQAFFTSFVTWFFYLPMAFLGVPPLMYGVLHALNLIGQFWLHTELIRSVGPLESVINTPSHHRVHHGQNPQYLDKNYGGTLMLWDHLFGTFEKEVEPVVYGITKPLNSYNNLWAQFHYFVELYKESKAAPRWQDKILVWLKGPAWSPEGLPPKVIPHGINRDTFVKHDPHSKPQITLYSGMILVSAVGLLFYLMVWGGALGLGISLLSTGALILSMVSIGALIEGRQWALRLELFRLGLLAGIVVGLSSTSPHWLLNSSFAILLLCLRLLWLRTALRDH